MYQQIITIYDYLLMPLYLLLFFIIVKEKSQKYKGTPLRKFFMLAFWVHMFGAVVFSMLMQYYYGYSDSFGYYTGGDIFRNLFLKDPSIKYFFYSGDDMVSIVQASSYAEKMPLMMEANPNLFIMKVSAVLSFLCFNKYLVISLCFGFFSFVGSWKLFYVMQKLNGGRHLQLLGYSTIATPSLWLWGSGLLKEPLCICALGVSIFILYKFFIQKIFSFKELLLLLLLMYILTVVKSYITIVFIVSAAFVLFIKVFRLIKNLALRIVAVVLIIFMGIVLLLNLDLNSYVQDAAATSFSQIESYRNSYEYAQGEDENSKAGFTFGDVTPTFEGLLLKAPQVIGTSLFRPFIWESGKVIILFAAFETLLVFLATLFIILKSKIFGFFVMIINNPYRLFCFLFSILFAAIIGYTTFNFGTIVRYKIIFLPFYFFLLINMYSTISLKKVSNDNSFGGADAEL